MENFEIPNQPVSNEERRSEIRALISIYQPQPPMDEYFMSRIPLREEDPEGELFDEYHTYIQSLMGFNGLPDENKCEEAHYLIHNAKFNLPINTVVNYYVHLCLGTDDL